MTKRSSRRLGRRQVSALAAGALAAPALVGARAAAQGQNVVDILSHRVHQQVITGTTGTGGDVTAAWRERSNARFNWTTLDVAPLNDRLLREASLASTEIDLGFIVNVNAVPRVLGLMQPLDELMAAEPIEDWSDVSPGLVAAMKSGGTLRGVPQRHATTALHYNEELLRERGLSGPPTTIEELIEYAKRLTYTRADGTQVHGFAIEGVSYVNMVTFSLAYDAPFIDERLQLLPNEAGMVQTFAVFRELFQAGVLPRNFAALRQDEVITMMQTGRLAMCYFAFGRHLVFNDPQQSRFPGKIKSVAPPASQAIKARVPLVGTTEFWSMVIPRSAANQRLTWSLIREISSKENTIRQALNGNGPIRSSAYADPRIQSVVPYAAAEAEVLRHTRAPLPAFDRSVEAGDILAQQMQACVVGQATPEAAVAELKRRVAPLLG